jgi:GMP synthase-like glutamine amidotransferase
MDILVLQHIACEPPAEYGTVLSSRGHSLHTVAVDEGEALPDWREFGAIIAMGGPMGAYEDDTYPWLVPEKQLIGDAVRAGLPYFGVCLGVQLLAAALGARVYPGAAPEVGLLEVLRTEDGGSDPVASILPERFTTLQWHGDTFDLPTGAVSLFSTRTRASASARSPTACSSTSRLMRCWPTSGRACPPIRRRRRTCSGPADSSSCSTGCASTPIGCSPTPAR